VQSTAKRAAIWPPFNHHRLLAPIDSSCRKYRSPLKNCQHGFSYQRFTTSASLSSQTCLKYSSAAISRGASPAARRGYELRGSIRWRRPASWSGPPAKPARAAGQSGSPASCGTGHAPFTVATSSGPSSSPSYLQGFNIDSTRILQSPLSASARRASSHAPCGSFSVSTNYFSKESQACFRHREPEWP